MQLTIAQSKLSDVLAKAAAVVERKNTIPILSNILLSAETGILHVRASDLDIEVSTKTVAEVIDHGSTTVSASLLSDIVKRLGKKTDVTLHLDNGTLHVKSGRSKFKLATLPAEDFPVMSNNEFDNVSTVDASILLSIFNRTKFAMSTEEIRFYLNGVYLHNTDDGSLRGVSTDGHKLACMTTDIDAIVSPVIVPKKTVLEICKLVTSGDVELSTSGTKLKIVTDDVTMVSKVIDGTFPDYTKVIPKGNNKVAIVDAKDFSGASDRVTLVADNRTKAVKLSLSKDCCVMNVNSSSGEASEEISIGYSDDPMVIGFNSKYLSDALAQSENGSVELRFNGTTDPVLIEPREYEGFQAVVMPMRVN